MLKWLDMTMALPFILVFFLPMIFWGKQQINHGPSEEPQNLIQHILLLFQVIHDRIYNFVNTHMRRVDQYRVGRFA